MMLEMVAMMMVSVSMAVMVSGAQQWPLWTKYWKIQAREFK